jgi:hypothetical protein
VADTKKRTLRERIKDFSIGTGEKIVAGVVVAVAVALILGLIGFQSGSPGSESGASEELPIPPPALRAKDEATPDAKGAVREQVWSEHARTYGNPIELNERGPDIPHDQYVLVACKFFWPKPPSVKDDGYWYRIASGRWKDLFSPANSYWNGDIPGQRPYTHSTDWAVKDCPAELLPS